MKSLRPKVMSKLVKSLLSQATMALELNLSDSVIGLKVHSFIFACAKCLLESRNDP
jgi:hypothetical protein